MYKIAICIPTYKRPKMLKHLIDSIFESNFDKLLIKDVCIIIADNDIDKTAENILKEINVSPFGISKIEYFNHPYKGISNIRNALIKKAILLNPDYLVFIDDDEYVSSEWLNELVKTISSNDADAARGPVLAKVAETIPNYVSYWFKRESYPNNFQLNTLSTNSLILKKSSLQRLNLWFDTRFNITGSGDHYFGIQLLKKGARIVWAANAIAYETIPETRANIKWLLKRIYRGSSTYTYVLKLEKEYFKIAKKLLVSIIYIIAGFCSIFLFIIPIQQRYWGIYTFTKGIGGLTGLFNLLYKEYK